MKTEQQFIDELLSACQSGDEEADHVYADSLVIEALKRTGFDTFAEEYDKLRQNWWYA